MTTEVELDISEVSLLVHVSVYTIDGHVQVIKSMIVYDERLVLDWRLEPLKTAPCHVPAQPDR